MVTPDNDLIFAIDGGGSGCRLRVMTPGGEERASANGGAANFTTDPVQCIANLRQAISEVCTSLGVSDPAQYVAHVGLAGVLNDNDAQQVAAQLPFATCRVSDDRLTSAIGALGAADGVLLAVGTGSFVAARRGGDLRYLGGWGSAVGDQASGGWLGRAALEHTLLAFDGLRDATGVTAQILGQFDNDPAKLAAFSMAATPEDFGGFAPSVVAGAASGDPVATALMHQGAAYLNACLDWAAPVGDDRICLMGGVGPHYAPYLAEGHRARVTAPAGTALDGAMHLARQLWTARQVTA